VGPAVAGVRVRGEAARLGNSPYKSDRNSELYERHRKILESSCDGRHSQRYSAFPVIRAKMTRERLARALGPSVFKPLHGRSE
jgi:hypothetical protein